MTMIWVWAIAICALPLGFLAVKNPKAIPAGALLAALVGAGGFGALAIGGAAWNPGSGDGIVPLVIGVLVVLLILIALNLKWMDGPFVTRMNWAVGSMVVWLVVGTVIDFAWSEAQIEARSRESLAEQQRIDEAHARARADLDRDPGRRQAVLDRALAVIQPEVAKHYRKFDRFVVFGDAVKSPETVVVWAVIVPRPDFPNDWEGFGLDAENMHHRLNVQLDSAGYPARVGLGFAPAAAVAEAGGDQAYFGPKGEKLIPQFGPQHHGGRVAGRPEFGYPRRAG